MPTRVTLATAVLAAALLALALAPARSFADACTAPVVNEIACENSKPGADPEDWEVDRVGDEEIQGFATKISVDRGQQVGFKIKSVTSNYRVDIFRLGYYGGDGARLIAGNLAPTGTSSQPACQVFDDTGLIDCGNWATSLTWTVPATAVSGVYIAVLKRQDAGGGWSQIPFVVRNDASHADLVVQTSDQTWQAYNDYGGNSLYVCTLVCPPGHPRAYQAAFKVSYNRPIVTAKLDSMQNWLFGGEYTMIRYLEANGYDATYISGVDANSSGSLLLNHKVFVSSGHDEYWSLEQRENVEAARSAGVNLTFFSGNEVFWKTRFEPSQAGPTTADRTLVSYKDTHFDAPTDPVTWTGTWRDGRFADPEEKVVPENALTGQSFVVNSGSSAIQVPYQYKNLRLWRNIPAINNLASGQSHTLAEETLGYEWDADPDNGFRPAGTFRVSSTTVPGVEVFTDYGSTTKFDQTATHNMTMYRAASGALVFGAGTVQWIWGLDDYNPRDNPSDKAMRQATLNLFADMGAQPATRQSDLVAATASTDHTAPTATVTTAPASVADGAQVTISGTASDAGGGVVAGIEVSTDGGETWHPATSGTTSWSYSWIAHGNPSVTIKARAVDDSGNLGAASAPKTVAVTCPCSLWGVNTTVPAEHRDGEDPAPVEVGVKFKSDVFGTVTGIRFYKTAANTGTHTGSLWSAEGQRLAQATFTSESASGWQTVTFDTPVQVQPNTTYVASYYAPDGHYSASPDYFYPAPAPGPNGGATIDAAPLHAIRNSGSSVNGVYSYGAVSSFPTDTFGAANYWVDVLLTPMPIPGAVTGVTATAGGLTSANVTWTAPASGGAVTEYKVTPYVGSTAQAPVTVTGNPPVTTTTVTGLANGTTYTFKVQALNPNGGGPVSAASNAVTPLTAVAPSVPRDVAAVGASGAAKVSWTAPQSDGDAAITGYTITPYVDGDAQAPVSAGSGATSVTVTGLTNGTGYTFKVTATNSAGTSPAGTSAAVVPQATLLDFTTPATVDNDDPNAVELGVRFTPDYDGFVTGIRFYKSAANTGTHVGSLWTATGTKLASATFTSETASGWQTVTFSSPQAVTAGTTYVASYHAPVGHYSSTGSAFGSQLNNPPLRAPSNADGGNGVYAYAAASAFPTSSFQATNYFVDVLFALPKPGQVTGVEADASGATSATVSWTAPASGGPVQSYKLTPYVGATAQAPITVSGSATSKQVTGLTTGTAYTFTVQALNANGGGQASAASNAVTPTGPVAPSKPTGVDAEPASTSALVSWDAPDNDGDSPITGYTVTPYVGATAQDPVQVGAGTTSKTITDLVNGTAYAFRVTATNAIGESAPSAPSAAVTPQATLLAFPTPATADSGDTDAVTLGMKFTSDVAGTATGVRFYKAAGNTGTHVGALWAATGGAPLAQVTFANESASGWQHATFSSPVALTPGTTYVVGYLAPSGHYSVSGAAFTSTLDSPPLHAPAHGVTPNGVFAYGGSLAFPSSGFNATNYFVDVLFAPSGGPATPTGVTATAGEGSASVSWTPGEGGGAATSYVVTPYIGGAAQTATTVNGNPPATSATISGLTPGTAYTFRVRAVNASGSSATSAPSNSVTPTAATVPGKPTGVSAEADSTAAIVRWSAPASDGGSAITGYVVTPYDDGEAQPAVEVAASPRSARVTGLANGTAYTFTVAAKSAAGTGAASDPSAAITPKASLLEGGTPAIADAGDPDAVVLGVKLTAEVDGEITGLRFYKAAANTGTHVGAIWAADGGAPLRQATFTDESASGWQTLTFDEPLEIAADTTYVASYLAPNGHYSVTSAAFGGGPLDNPPLHALANGVSPNGVYAYSSSSVFPTGSWNATNYWVDVLFAPASED